MKAVIVEILLLLAILCNLARMAEINGSVKCQWSRQQHISFLLLAILIVNLSAGFVSSVSIEKDLTLTLQEKKALDKLRERVNPLLYNDFMKTDLYLIRWLRARNFNVDDAEVMLKENLKWRKENRMDGIQQENFDDMWETFPATADSQDKKGQPVGTIEWYDWDIRQAVLTGKARRGLRYLDMLMDNGTLQVFERQKRGMNVSQGIVLINVEGFGPRHTCPPCLAVYAQFLSSLENHFQGWLDELIIIEAPLAFQTVLNMFRPVLSQQTRDAMKVFSTNRKQWMDYLDQRISREERHPAYGGTKV